MSHTEQNCCERCHHSYGGKYGYHKDGCAKLDSCPCHTEQKGWGDWVRVLATSSNPRDIDLLIAKMEVFIERTLQEQRESEVERINLDFNRSLHQIRAEAGKNQLLLLSKVAKAFRRALIKDTKPL